MGMAMFYHLTRSPLEATLPMILSRSLEAGWRVAVRAMSPERLRALDDRLWLGDADSFLPHGVAGGDYDADQPILLTTATTTPNRANCLVLVDGAAVDPVEAAGFERIALIFDGNDDGAVAAARLQWKALTDAGISAQYWSEATGRWEKKADK